MSVSDSASDARSELEHEADVARARLLHTIDRLDRRRHEALDWRLQARRHSGELAVVAGALTLTFGVPIGLAIYRASTKSERLRKERLRAVLRFWEHPERVAQKRRHKLAWVLGALVVAAAGSAVTAAFRKQLTARQWPRFPAPPVEPFGL